MPELPTGIDTSRPHPARTYDYFLGGKNNFAADREVADRVLASWPAIRIGVRENRKFLARVVRYLAGEVGIRQFLDIGTGLPTADTVHEVAQAVAPAARVVYVDKGYGRRGIRRRCRPQRPRVRWPRPCRPPQHLT